MLSGRNRTRAHAAALFLAGGVPALIALAGCGSGGSTASPETAATSSLHPSAAATSSTAPTASAKPTASALPSWAALLNEAGGDGDATVVPPQSVAPGHDSPGAAMAGFLAALSTRHLSAWCDYVLPSAQEQCRSNASQTSASQQTYATNVAVGYVVIEGDRAVGGMTGTFCAPQQKPECFTNNNPAAVFSSANSFSELWEDGISNSGWSYSLTPFEKTGGKWYIYVTT